MTRNFVAIACLLLIPNILHAGGDNQPLKEGAPTIHLQSILSARTQDGVEKTAADLIEARKEACRLLKENAQLKAAPLVGASSVEPTAGGVGVKTAEDTVPTAKKLRAPKWFPDQIQEFHHEDFGNVLTASADGKIYVSTSLEQGPAFTARYKVAILKQLAVDDRVFFMLDGSQMAVFRFGL